MGLSEHALQYHMSDWSSCAIWDPYVARDPNPTRMEVSGEKNGFGTKNPISAAKLDDDEKEAVSVKKSSPTHRAAEHRAS